MSSENLKLFEHFRILYKKPYTILKICSDIVYSFLLGKGSFGAVLLCYNTNSDVMYIQKLLKAMSLEDIDYNELACMAYQKKYCKNYVVCLKAIDIRNIYQNNDVGDALLQTQVSIDMEFIGFSLETFIKSNDMLFMDKLIIMRKLLLGLNYMHNRIGIVHRDIKQGNVVINPYKLDVKYIDFGTACIKNLKNFNSILFSEFKLPSMPEIYLKSTYNIFSGTPLFTSPELFAPTKYNQSNSRTFDDLKKTDIWSLGVLFYWIFFKKYPFDSENILTLSVMVVEKKLDIIGDILEIRETIGKDGITDIFYMLARAILPMMMNKIPSERGDSYILTTLVGKSIIELFNYSLKTSYEYSEDVVDKIVSDYLTSRSKHPIAKDTAIFPTNEKEMEKTVSMSQEKLNIILHSAKAKAKANIKKSSSSSSSHLQVPE